MACRRSTWWAKMSVPLASGATQRRRTSCRAIPMMVSDGGRAGTATSSPASTGSDHSLSPARFQERIRYPRPGSSNGLSIVNAKRESSGGHSVNAQKPTTMR